MGIDSSYALNASFSGVPQLQANGTIDSGNNLPTGISTFLYIGNACMTSTITSSESLTALGRRSELKFNENTRAEWWYKWDFMCPSEWNDTLQTVVMQIHDSPDGGDQARHPNFLVTLFNGNISIIVPSATLPAEGVTGIKFPLIKLVKNKWYSFCLRANWQIDNTGFRQFFIDNVDYFTQWNTPTGYDDVVGPYLKLGVYDYFSVLSSGSQTAYYKNVEIWSGNNSFSTVLGKTPIAPKVYLQNG